MSNDEFRHPVNYRYDALNWDFLRLMAEIAAYADKKYAEHGGVHNYTSARLTGDKSPINHATEHLHMYITGELHDKFGTLKHQLAALAYNAMMEFFYLEKFGHEEHKLVVNPPGNGHPLAERRREDITPGYEKVKTILTKAENEIRKDDAVSFVQNDRELEIVKEGFKARWEGARQLGNPYQPTSIAHRLWNDGYIQAEIRILAGHNREDSANGYL